MNFKQITRQIIVPTLALLLITAVVTAAVVGVHELTAGWGGKAPDKRQELIAEVFEGEYEEKADGVYNFVSKWLVFESAKGYGGEVELAVVLSCSGCGSPTVKEVRVISDSETPSLGRKKVTENAEYLAKYAGKQKLGDDLIITGATVSSSAVRAGVQNAIEQVKALEKMR